MDDPPKARILEAGGTPALPGNPFGASTGRPAPGMAHTCLTLTHRFCTMPAHIR